MIKMRLKAIGMLVGMIFGAGVFALPFAFSKAGVFWGTAHFFIALAIMIFLHFWYGEIVYFMEGRRRFTGYAEMLLGKKAKWFALLITFFTYYGAIFAYGFLGGIFLANIFNVSPFILSLLVFVAASFLIFLKAEFTASVNFYLSIALFGLVAYLFFAALPFIRPDNLFGAGFDFFPEGGWFLPYGIWIFSLAGFAVLPEVRDIISKTSLKNFKRIILISLILCAIFYFIFAITIVGLSGINTSKDALSGLAGTLGKSVIIAGSVLGFLAVFTSFIALGADLKNIFIYDFRMRKVPAWLSVVFPPIFLLLIGAKDFIKILGIAGSVGLGLTGILVILMRKKLAERKNEKIFHRFIWIIGGLVAAGIIAAVISEL